MKYFLINVKKIYKNKLNSIPVFIIILFLAFLYVGNLKSATIEFDLDSPVSIKEDINSTSEQIKLFEKKFDKGESVKGYLSKKAFDVEFKDILLNQWGIKHLHLTDKEANSIEEMKNNRSNILLFFIVDNQDVYFLDVRKHPKGAGFITLEVLSIVYNNRWMEKIGARKVEGIIDLQPEIDSNEELYKLYKNGINYNMFKFGNEVYMMGWGVSSEGHKMDYSIILCELNRKISQISCKYGDRYAGFELTLDGHFGNVILEGSGNKILI